MTAQTKWGEIAGVIAPPSENPGAPPLEAGSDIPPSLQRSPQAVELVYSTYLGGGGDDLGWDIVVDRSGDAYAMGWTSSSDFPTQGPYQMDQGGSDVFVNKLSGSGSSLVYSTYIGGGSEDYAYGVAVDSSGGACLIGWTTSSDFPTQNPFQANYGGYRDVFVAKLSSSGNSLIYSTYLGGGYFDSGYGIAVDSSGNAYVTGHTESSDFPTQNPFQTYQGWTDVFVTKLSSSGNNLIYSTYLGGGDVDYGVDIVVDGGGNAYVTGYTLSGDFPTCNPYQTYQGGCDVFVIKLAESGDSLIYSTYLGGESAEYGRSIAIDDSGYAYVTGDTYSFNFPTQNPYQTNQTTYDAFVTKLSSSGNSLAFSTYLGGGGGDYGTGIEVEPNGNVWVAGFTDSGNFPTKDPFQPLNYGGLDVFLTELPKSGSSLVYSTYLGGEEDDRAYGIAVNMSGNVYLTGRTTSASFPTKNPCQTYQGAYDVFVTELGELGSYACGDVNVSGLVDFDDVVYLLNYIFSSGTPPEPIESGDANCSGGNPAIDIDDVVYLITYIFAGGPAPCAECP
jgi:hypothetical protein